MQFMSVDQVETDEERELRQQEEDLMRENEEAMMMAIDAGLVNNEGALKQNGLINVGDQNPGPVTISEADTNGNGFKPDAIGSGSALETGQERTGVLSH